MKRHKGFISGVEIITNMRKKYKKGKYYEIEFYKNLEDLMYIKGTYRVLEKHREHLYVEGKNQDNPHTIRRYIQYPMIQSSKEVKRIK